MEPNDTYAIMNSIRMPFILSLFVCISLGATIAKSSNTHSLCSYLVQIEPGEAAKREHNEYLSQTENLDRGVQEEWEIGQTFQGYHMDLCKTISDPPEDPYNSFVFAQQVRDQWILLAQAPSVVALERNGEVRQAGWVEQEPHNESRQSEEEETEADEIRLIRKEEQNKITPSIVGQQAATIACQNDATWSLHRMGFPDVTLPLPTNDLKQVFPYVYEPINRPIVYIMDTEVFTQNTQYGGRAQQVKSFVGTDESKLPFPPHGSHVAGIIGSARYGVQKWAHLLSVVTLSRAGTGSWSNILNAATWVAKDAAERKPAIPAIVNLSLSGSKSEIINAAMNAMVDAGLVVIVAVGNSNLDACNQSPASAGKPIKVAAHDNADNFSSFSNWGQCVDVIAPGSLISSTGPYNKQLMMSGTSMASPAVAGIIASALGYGILKPEVAKDNYQLKYYLNASGKTGAVRNVPTGTPNVLIQTGYEAQKCAKSEKRPQLTFQHE